jgi:uncharacterized protein
MMTKTPLVLAALLMCAHPAIAGVKDGVDAWSRGDYPGAVAQWRQPAIDGDADAQFNMGQAYKLGRGVASDLKIAEDWYRRAAAKGHVQAEDNLGLVMFQNGDRQRAMPYIEKSAARGEPRAQYILGTALFNADMVKKDWVRAYAFMTRASAAGLAPASASLAQMDRYVPLDQRQKAMILARELEAQTSRPFAQQSATPAIPKRSIGVVKTESVAASAPANRTIIAGTAPRPPAKPAPAAKPSTVSAAPAAGGKWRVQLGAFSDAGKAGALWKSLSGRVAQLGDLQSYQVKAGAVTRLQAGPLATRADAERVCGAVKATGQPCLTIGI